MLLKDIFQSVVIAICVRQVMKLCNLLFRINPSVTLSTSLFKRIQKKRTEGKCGKEAMIAGLNKFLRTYYGRVSEVLPLVTFEALADEYCTDCRKNESDKKQIVRAFKQSGSTTLAIKLLSVLPKTEWKQMTLDNEPLPACFLASGASPMLNKENASAKAEGAASYTAGLNAKLLTAVDSSQNIELKTELGTLSIPGNMLSNLETAQTGEVGISIGAADKSSLPEEVRNSIGDRPVIELSVSVGTNRIEYNNPARRFRFPFRIHRQKRN
jgi:hypothetical protein